MTGPRAAGRPRGAAGLSGDGVEAAGRPCAGTAEPQDTRAGLRQRTDGPRAAMSPPPNPRQNAVLRQTVHVASAVAVAVHRPAAMAVGWGRRRLAHGHIRKKCPAFQYDLPA
jgi:hypothetical protein